jgi:hypothetical protein
MSIHKIMTGIVGLVAVIALVASLSGGEAPSQPGSEKEVSLGGLKRGIYQALLHHFGNGIMVGPNEDGNTLFMADNCTLITGSASHPASSTRPYDCAVTGVKSTDLVMGQISTSTPIGTGQTRWEIFGAKASSTDGYVTFLLYNNGPATNPSQTSVGSSTNYMVFRP